MHARPVSCLRIATALCLVATGAQAQTPKPPTQLISISPLSLVFGVIGAEYERRIGSNSSWGVSASWYQPELFSYASTEAKWRYYPQEKALEGFSVGLTGGLTRIGTRNTSPSSAGTAANLGFSLDYQWLLGPRKRFAVTLGTGAHRFIPLGSSVSGASLILPTARISIGRGF